MAAKTLFDGAVSVDPHVLSGAPVFAGTRVPVKNLFDYLASGKTVDEFLEAFDWVERKHVKQLAELHVLNLF